MPSKHLNGCLIMKSLTRLAPSTQAEVLIMVNFALQWPSAEIAAQVKHVLFLMNIQSTIQKNLEQSPVKKLWCKRFTKEDQSLVVLQWLMTLKLITRVEFIVTKVETWILFTMSLLLAMVKLKKAKNTGQYATLGALTGERMVSSDSAVESITLILKANARLLYLKTPGLSQQPMLQLTLKKILPSTIRQSMSSHNQSVDL